MTPAADRSESTLDSAGVPDLSGPLPDKEQTGDPQEGGVPPTESRATFERDLDEAEREVGGRGESIERRMKRETSDSGGPRDSDAPVVVIVDDASDDGIDFEKDLAADYAVEEPSLSAEEAAVHIVDDAPGGVDGPDSYLEGDADR